MYSNKYKEYKKNKNELIKANNLAEKKIQTIHKLLEGIYKKKTSDSLNVEKIRLLNNQLNVYTHNIIQIENFLDNTRNTQLIPEFEKIIILGNCKRYSLKLMAIYDLLDFYNTNPKDRPEEQKVFLPNKIKE